MMHYRPQLDGFRGLCIAAVFLFHAQFLDCGWIGVQAFFVLSGYLISQGLLDSKVCALDAREFFIRFYARRALRIFPAYFCFIAATVMLAYALDTPTTLAMREHFAENIPYLATYTYNFYRWKPELGSAIYGHLWSLSIEEQFYLIWPLLAFALKRRTFFGVCFFLAIAGPLVRLAELAGLVALDPQRLKDAGKLIYFGTVSHVDAFAFGAILVFRGEERWADELLRLASRWAPITVLATGLAMLLLPHRGQVPASLSSLGWPIYLAASYAFVWGYTLLDAAFLVAVDKADRGQFTVDNKLVRRLGKVSYGFYIYHLPILWFTYMATGARRGTFTALNLFATVAAFAVTWVVAEASFRLIEMPFLRLKTRFGTSREQQATRAVPEGA